MAADDSIARRTFSECGLAWQECFSMFWTDSQLYEAFLSGDHVPDRRHDYNKPTRIMAIVEGMLAEVEFPTNISSFGNALQVLNSTLPVSMRVCEVPGDFINLVVDVDENGRRERSHCFEKGAVNIVKKMQKGCPEWGGVGKLLQTETEKLNYALQYSRITFGIWNRLVCSEKLGEIWFTDGQTQLMKTCLGFMGVVNHCLASAQTDFQKRLGTTDAVVDSTYPLLGELGIGLVPLHALHAKLFVFFRKSQDLLELPRFNRCLERSLTDFYEPHFPDLNPLIRVTVYMEAEKYSCVIMFCERGGKLLYTVDVLFSYRYVLKAVATPDPVTTSTAPFNNGLILLRELFILKCIAAFPEIRFGLLLLMDLRNRTPVFRDRISRWDLVVLIWVMSESGVPFQDFSTVLVRGLSVLGLSKIGSTHQIPRVELGNCLNPFLLTFPEHEMPVETPLSTDTMADLALRLRMKKISGVLEIQEGPELLRKYHQGKQSVHDSMLTRNKIKTAISDMLPSNSPCVPLAQPTYSTPALGSEIWSGKIDQVSNHRLEPDFVIKPLPRGEAILTPFRQDPNSVPTPNPSGVPPVHQLLPEQDPIMAVLQDREKLIQFQKISTTSTQSPLDIFPPPVSPTNVTSLSLSSSSKSSTYSSPTETAGVPFYQTSVDRFAKLTGTENWTHASPQIVMANPSQNPVHDRRQSRPLSPRDSGRLMGRDNSPRRRCQSRPPSPGASNNLIDAALLCDRLTHFGSRELHNPVPAPVFYRSTGSRRGSPRRSPTRSDRNSGGGKTPYRSNSPIGNKTPRRLDSPVRSPERKRRRSPSRHDTVPVRSRERSVTRRSDGNDRVSSVFDENFEPSRKLYVSDIHATTTHQQMQDVFLRHGHAKIFMKPSTWHSRSKYAWLTFDTVEEATNTLKKDQGVCLDKRNLRLYCHSVYERYQMKDFISERFDVFLDPDLSTRASQLHEHIERTWKFMVEDVLVTAHGTYVQFEHFANAKEFLLNIKWFFFQEKKIHIRPAKNSVRMLTLAL